MARDGKFTPAVAAAIVARAGQRCERCGVSCTGYRGTDWSIQHRKARGMGGTTREVSTSDGVVLCGSATTGCHGWVESHPTESAVDGWRLGQWGDPADVPIKHYVYGWCLLDAEACYVRTEAPA